MTPTNGLPAGTSEPSPNASADPGPSPASATLLELLQNGPPTGLPPEITALWRAFAGDVETFARECAEAEATGKEVFLVLKRDGYSEAELGACPSIGHFLL